jgi:hypothetical protein
MKYPSTAGWLLFILFSFVPSHYVFSTEMRQGSIRQGGVLQGGSPETPAARCQAGYVWRERFEGDSVCVTPDQRYKLQDGTCRSGYVWRDSFPGDGVCVTPAQRAAAKAARTPLAQKPGNLPPAQPK